MGEFNNPRSDASHHLNMRLNPLFNSVHEYFLRPSEQEWTVCYGVSHKEKQILEATVAQMQSIKRSVPF